MNVLIMNPMKYNWWVQVQVTLLVFKRPCNVTSTIIDHHRDQSERGAWAG